MNEEPPGCLQVEVSTFGKAQIKVSDNVLDTLNPFKDQVLKVGSDENKAWRMWNAEPNWQMVPREERSMGEMCLPPDHCASYLSPQEEGTLTPMVFRLPKMDIGLIVVCFGKGDSATKMLEAGVASYFDANFDGSQLDPAKYKQFPNGKCLSLQDEFNGPVHDTNGHLYLSIVAKKSIAISQVIAT